MKCQFYPQYLDRLGSDDGDIDVDDDDDDEDDDDLVF